MPKEGRTPCKCPSRPIPAPALPIFCTSIVQEPCQNRERGRCRRLGARLALLPRHGDPDRAISFPLLAYHANPAQEPPRRGRQRPADRSRQGRGPEGRCRRRTRGPRSPAPSPGHASSGHARAPAANDGRRWRQEGRSRPRQGRSPAHGLHADAPSSGDGHAPPSHGTRHAGGQGRRTGVRDRLDAAGSHRSFLPFRTPAPPLRPFRMFGGQGDLSLSLGIHPSVRAAAGGPAPAKCLTAPSPALCSCPCRPFRPFRASLAPACRPWAPSAPTRCRPCPRTSPWVCRPSLPRRCPSARSLAWALASRVRHQGAPAPRIRLNR